MATVSTRRALFIANSSWYLLNFRANVMARLRERGWEVHAVAPPSEHTAALTAQDFEFVPWQISGGGYAVGRELAALVALIGICRRLSPALVHSFTIKATLHAQLASLFGGVPAPVASITGLGHAYLRGGATRLASELL